MLNDIVYIKTPTPEQKLIAHQIYLDTLYDTEFEGVLTDNNLQQVLISNGLWSQLEEDELSTAPQRMDDIKEEMYRCYAAFQSERVKKIRTTLERSRIRAGLLFRKKHSYDMCTCNGLATLFQIHYIITHNAINMDGQPIQNMDDIYLRTLAEEYAANRPADGEIRQLAKNDAWKSIWHSSKGSTSVFGIPAIGLSDEQRSLLGWSRLYDNIMEATQPPDKIVLVDDDLLDGWLIVQHKKSESDRDSNDDVKSRHPGADEVFIPVETAQDAKRVYGVNSADMKMIAQQRALTIKKYGRVAEQHLPDSRQQINMQATQATLDRR